jgi:hypothetical protein
MKVNEFAHAYNITTKELLAELKSKFPGQKFTANTELPSGFERTVQEQAQEYAQISDIVLPETSSDIAQTGEDAIVDHKVQEAFHYGILEAISQMRKEDFALDGQVSAVEDILTYRASYNEVWTLFHQGEVTHQELRNQGLSDRLDAIAETKQNMGKQLGKHEQIAKCVTNTKQQLKDKLASLLG